MFKFITWRSVISASLCMLCESVPYIFSFVDIFKSFTCRTTSENDTKNTYISYIFIYVFFIQSITVLCLTICLDSLYPCTFWFAVHYVLYTFGSVVFCYFCQNDFSNLQQLIVSLRWTFKRNHYLLSTLIVKLNVCMLIYRRGSSKGHGDVSRKTKFYIIIFLKIWESVPAKI